MPNTEVYISTPTWANHHNIWRDARVPAKAYRYYKPETRGLDFEGMMEDMSVSAFVCVFIVSLISISQRRVAWTLRA